MVVSCTIDIPKSAQDVIAEETAMLFELHPEYVWFDPKEYHIPVYTWQDVSPDLLHKLTIKIDQLFFDQSQFFLYGAQYIVTITSHIDIALAFQAERSYRQLIRTLHGYFGEQKQTPDNPQLCLARYKIPSKQQYSHLKNKLEKLTTSVELSVDHVSLQKVTDFGHGVKTYETIETIPIHQTA